MILCFCFYYFFTVCFKIGSLFFCKTTTKQCKISIWQKKKLLRKYKHQKNILGLIRCTITHVYNLFQRKNYFSSWCPELSCGAEDISVSIWVWWLLLSLKSTGFGGTLGTKCMEGREMYYLLPVTTLKPSGTLRRQLVTLSPASNPLGDTIVHFL